MLLLLSPSSSNESGHVHVTQTQCKSNASSPFLSKPGQQEITRLVDDLLRYTRTLMDSHLPKNGNESAAAPFARHILAFSGGVDSSLVAQLLHTCQLPGEQVTAVLGLSPAVPSHQVELAQQVASHIGIELQMVPTTEGSDETYIANAGQACYACKTHLYQTLQAIHRHHHSSAPKNDDVKDTLFYNGTNADDLLDPTRLGLVAADEFRIMSPLRYTPKEQVRLAAKHLNMPNWEYAASPCLRSRLALGVPATKQHLQQMEEAEALVKRVLGLGATVNLRVRLLGGGTARIEVDEDWLEAAVKIDWNSFFQEHEERGLSFNSVSVRPFKSGSVAKESPKG
jgi:uncharacterized protein